MPSPSVGGFTVMLQRKPDSSSRIPGTVFQRTAGDKLNISLENALEQYRTVPCQ